MKNLISKEQLKLTFLGGAGFLVETAGTTAAIDPYLGGDAKQGFERRSPSPVGYEDLAGIDYLISTHGHLDHCEPKLITYLAQNSSCRFLGPQSSIESIMAAGVADERVTCLDAGDKTDLGTLELQAVSLYDPYEPYALGIVLRQKKLSILHAGDSHYSGDYNRLADQMNIDIALLSSGRKLYMSPEEIFKAANDLGCQALVPIHWDLWKALYIPMKEIEETYNKDDGHNFSLIPMVAGNSLVLSKKEDSLQYEICK